VDNILFGLQGMEGDVVTCGKGEAFVGGSSSSPASVSGLGTWGVSETAVPDPALRSLGERFLVR